MQEWDEKMKDYEPEYAYMIVIPYLKPLIYYEQFKEGNAKIKGAFIGGEKGENLQLNIYDPSEKIVYQNATNELIFEFTTTTAGLYKIMFYNNTVDL